MTLSTKRSFLIMERRPVFLGVKNYGAVPTTLEKPRIIETEKVLSSSWLKMLACGFIMFVVHIIRRTFNPAKGVISQAVFQPEDTMIRVGSIEAACFIVTAPVAGLMVAKHGGKCVAIVGCVLVSAGLLLTSWAADLLLLLLGHSLLGGVGQCLATVACLMSAAGTHTRVHLSLAWCLSGLVLGSLVPEHFFTFLLETWGWRVEFRVISIFALLGVAAAVHLDEEDKTQAMVDRSVVTKVVMFLIMMMADAGVYLASLMLYHQEVTPLSETCFLVHALMSLVAGYL